VRLVGQATSAAQFFRQTGATVGAALMGTVLASTLALSFSRLDLPEDWLARSGVSPEELVATGGADLPARIGSVYEQFAAEASSREEAQAVLAQGALLSDRIGTQIREAFWMATTRIYWLTSLLVALATALVLRIPELPLRTTHDRASMQPRPPHGGP
jgi:hypothetical protein